MKVEGCRYIPQMTLNQVVDLEWWGWCSAVV